MYLAGWISRAMLSLALTGPSVLFAQDRPILSAWQDGLKGLACEASVSGRLELDDILTLVASFADRDVPEIARAAGFELTAYILDGGQIARAQNAESYAERFVAAAPEGLAQFQAASRRHGFALCPVVDHMVGLGLRQVVGMQVNTKPYYRPHVQLAQILLNAHGCEAGQTERDPLPKSRA